jgi:hypothetical protein
MLSAFFGGFLGASLVMHPSIAATIINGILILMALLVVVPLLCFLVGATVYYLWRFVIPPVAICFVAVIGGPFYVIFILAPWCLRRLSRTTPAADDLLWHPLR